MSFAQTIKRPTKRTKIKNMLPQIKLPRETNFI